MKFCIPIKLPSLANSRLHWQKMACLKRSQRAATKICMVGCKLPSPPLVVTITRIGPSRLDDDNLAAACKYVRDQIANIVGIDDGSDWYTWRYAQRIGDYAVEVEVTSR